MLSYMLYGESMTTRMAWLVRSSSNRDHMHPKYRCTVFLLHRYKLIRRHRGQLACSKVSKLMNIMKVILLDGHRGLGLYCPSNLPEIRSFRFPDLYMRRVKTPVCLEHLEIFCIWLCRFLSTVWGRIGRGRTVIFPSAV